MTYRFRELVVADFEQNEGALTVSVYDMGSPLDAYGIFETEKPAEAKELADVGTAALLQPPYRGLLIKDRFYVKVEAGGGDIGTEALAEALRGVAEGLPGINGLPAELALLPAEGRVAGTLAFAGSDYLGLEDLKACLHAQYQDAEGEDYGLFVMKPSSTFLKNEAGKWATFAHGEHQVFSREIPYRGMIVLMGNREQLIGVSGFNEIERATVLLENLMR